MDFVPKFLNDALSPVSKEIGDRLADIVSLAFTPIIKFRIKRDYNLELFTEKLKNNVEKIPEENLVSPPVHIVGPILDDVAKYYHDEEYLREMFSNLITSTMDKTQCGFVHPSYKSIIEQLSPFDAILLKQCFAPYKTIIKDPDLRQLSFLCAESSNNYTMEEYSTYFIPESARRNVAFKRDIFFSTLHGYDYLRGTNSNSISVDDVEYSLEQIVSSLNSLDRLCLLTTSEGTLSSEEINKIKTLSRKLKDKNPRIGLLYKYCVYEPERLRLLTVMLSTFGVSFCKSCIGEIDISEIDNYN